MGLIVDSEKYYDILFCRYQLKKITLQKYIRLTAKVDEWESTYEHGVDTLIQIPIQKPWR